MAGPGTGILSFGLVAIPIGLQSAIKDQSVHFHYLHAKCGSRIQNQVFCATCNRVIQRSDLSATISSQRTSTSSLPMRARGQRSRLNFFSDLVRSLARTLSL